jgi:hypothetical protein
MNALEESLLIELDGSKKIQIQGKPVAELEGKPRSAGKVEAVNDVRIPKGTESCFGRGGDHLAVPNPVFMSCHGNFLV